MVVSMLRQAQRPQETPSTAFMLVAVVEPVETTVVMVCLCAEFSNGRFDASTSSATTGNAFDRVYASGGG